jgi:predicted GIY-YIG superfamily endonuclease
VKWNYANCKKEANKYNYKTDFIKNSKSAYNSAIRNGWLNEICYHMNKIGNRFFRCIYVWEFEDNSAYVGLTYNIIKRTIEHKTEKDSPVYKKLKYSKGFCTQLTDYIPLKDAIKSEIFFIEKYKKNWNVLNKNKGGSLGSSYFECTVEDCIKYALSCRTKAEFQKKYKKYYNYSVAVDIYNTLFDHLNYSKNNSGYWSKEKCHEVALKCKNNKEFEIKYSSAYVIARKKKWFNEITTHFIEIKKPQKFWSIEKSLEIAKTYSSRSELKKKYYQAYFILKNNKLLDGIFGKNENNKPNSLTKGICHEYALKCQNRGEFQKKYKTYYSKSLKNNWINDICSHMTTIKKDKGFWTIEKAVEIANICENKKELRIKYSRAYNLLLQNNLVQTIMFKN